MHVPYDVTSQQTSLLTILYLERLLTECSLGSMSAVPRNDLKRPQILSVIHSTFRGQESKPGSAMYVAGVFKSLDRRTITQVTNLHPFQVYDT